MIDSFLLGISAVAALLAALSAFFSYRVSVNSLIFQKNYSKNQYSIALLNSTIYKLRMLKYSISNSLEISDEQYEINKQLFLDVQLDLQRLEELSIFDFSSYQLSKAKNLGEIIVITSSGDACITEVINAMEVKLSCIFR